MIPPVTEQWTAPTFLSEAHAWIDARLADLGRTRSGEIEQPHVRAWSTVMRVPTDDGDVWFKVNHEPLRHEAAVVSLLAQRMPRRVPPLLAADLDRGWMLMDDAGRRLREVIAEEGNLDRWPDVLEAVARIQLACEDDVDAFLDMGVPDLRLSLLPAKYAEFLDRYGDQLEPRLRIAPHLVAEQCEQLASYGIRDSIEHDDCHDGQIFLKDGVHLVMDWGDACVTHPFFTLAVTLLGVIAWGIDDVEDSEPLDRHLEAYLGPYFERYDGDLEAAARLAMRLGWVVRTINTDLATEADSLNPRMRMFVDGKP